MKHPAYTSYRSSGVEWLGDVPEHWDVKRLKYSASINDEVLSENTSSGFEFAYVDISSVDQYAGIVSVEEMTFESAPARARRIVRDGDTIVSTVRTYLRAIAPIRASKENLIVSTGFAVIRPMNIDPGFLSYALRETGFVETIVARSFGVSYPAINASDIGLIPIPIPPQVEQKSIAVFLDRETTKVDKLIIKNRALVKELEEKRTTFISTIIARGLPPEVAKSFNLDPHPKLKSSGIDWLGKVPEHWGRIKLKFLVSFYGGGTPSKGELDYWKGEIPWVSPKDMKSDTVIDTEDHITEEAVVNSATRIIPIGAVLIVVRSGILKHSIPVAINVRPVTLNQDMKALLPKKSLEAAYLKYFIIGYQNALLVEWRKEGTTVESIEHNLLANTTILVPPVFEQQAIIKYLDSEIIRIDQMNARVAEIIECLQEYRAALISAAVTGKINIQEATA